MVWREKPDLDLERLIMGRIASDMAATDACTADCITFSSDVLSICVAMVGVFPSSPPWIKLLLALCSCCGHSVSRKESNGHSLDPFRSGASGDKVILLYEQSN